MIPIEDGEKLLSIESFDYKVKARDINVTPDHSLQNPSLARKYAMEVDTSNDANPYQSFEVEKKKKKYKIEARDIILRNFNADKIVSKNADFLAAYLSTPQFVKALAGLCDVVMSFNTNKERLLGLKSELCKINR